MAASKKVRIDADTSGISAALSRVDKGGKDINRSMGGALPILNKMNIGAAAVGITIATVVNSVRQWEEMMRKGNEQQEKAVTSARKLAAATGNFGEIRQFASHAGAVSTQGTLGRDELLGAAGAFRAGAPAASARATRTAMAQAQRAGTTGQDANKVSQLAGQLLQIGVINTGNEDDNIVLAYDYAGFLIAELGQDADRAAEVLPRLIASGLSLDDAMGVYMGMRGMGRNLRSAAMSALQQAPRIRGIEGARRVIGRHEMFRGEAGQRAVAGMTAPADVAGFQARAMEGVVSDPETRQQIRIEVLRNMLEEKQLLSADPDRQELEEAQRLRQFGTPDPLRFRRAWDWGRRLVGSPGSATQDISDNINTMLLINAQYTPQEE